MHIHKFLSLTLLIASVTLSSPIEHASTLAPLHVPLAPTHDLINSSYIVILRDDILPSVFTAHMDFLEMLKELHSASTAAIVLEHVYDSAVAKGYSGTFTRDVLDRIRSRPEVKYVEQDLTIHLANYEDSETQISPPWGLTHINHKHIPFGFVPDYTYSDISGAGVMVYIIDSGVYIKHKEFEGRAYWGESFIIDGGHEDDIGHGTHAAGIIASNKYGVAKKAEITSVKIFGLKGSKVSTSIAALQWVLEDSKRRSTCHKKGFVVNVSYNTRAFSNAQVDAVNKVVEAGLHVVVAAGNGPVDACYISPAASTQAITVGATTSGNRLLSNSNYGRCVDILAPGQHITSCGIKGWEDFVVMSGTSMATAHVSGLVAYFLSIYPHPTFHPPWTFSPSYKPFDLPALGVALGTFLSYFANFLPSTAKIASSVNQDVEGDDLLCVQSQPITPDQMKTALRTLATKNIITYLPPNTPNLLVYNNYNHRDFCTGWCM